MNWTEAQTYCREIYMDLATIENTDEINKFLNTVSSFGLSSNVWIGLYTTINWRWSDGYTGTGAEYRNWKYDSQPDFYSASEFCVKVAKDGTWWDDNCFAGRYFICYRGTQQNPEFVASKVAMTWSSAQSYCRKNFIDLAIVRNQNENQAVANVVPVGYLAWVGLFRDPDFYWSDGSSFSFTNWYSGYNPLGSMRVACGVAALQSSGTWKFLPCETRLPFVCYSVPVSRQAVKLKIKLEDSSVDLNDPAVKADMLKKLLDWLKEKGIRVALKWREEPDGKVFQKENKTEL
ncbi:macrophage mannose receptor 1-like [Micropterus salmoides]|uniref:macrophage mannose receptor 1-like n=1 Tax=Micropterus salmoides TaxID=27706 RepID=UPI0018EC898A|nr:macrophage mannose receptor 1-like [Micropterus salmoides]